MSTNKVERRVFIPKSSIPKAFPKDSVIKMNNNIPYCWVVGVDSENIEDIIADYLELLLTDQIPIEDIIINSLDQMLNGQVCIEDEEDE